MTYEELLTCNAAKVAAKLGLQPYQVTYNRQTPERWERFCLRRGIVEAFSALDAGAFKREKPGKKPFKIPVPGIAISKKYVGVLYIIQKRGDLYYCNHSGFTDTPCKIIKRSSLIKNYSIVSERL